MSNADLKILITNELAHKILESIDFPLTITIPNKSFAPDGDLSTETETETDIVETDNTILDLESTANSPRPEDPVRNNAILLRDLQLEVDAEDIEIVNALRADVNTASSDDEDRTPSSGKLKKFKNTLLGPIKKALSIKLVWVTLEIDKPNFTLGEQILLLNVEVLVQIKFRVCIKYFGKEISKTFQTERMTLEARQLRFDLQAQAAKVSVLPSFTDVDVVLTFSMLGINFTARPGITSIVNRQLRKQGPLTIIDLTSFEHSMPFSSGKLVVDSIALASDTDGLAINVIMKIE